MSEHPGAGRLDAETLAAYIDGQLSPEERARVEAELAADPESYEWMVNAVSAVDDAGIPEVAVTPPDSMRAVAPEPEPGSKPDAAGGDGEPRGRVLPFYRRRSVQGLAGTLIAAAAAIVVVVQTQPAWWQGLWGPAVDPRFAKLVEAVGEERYIEARLTGGFKYGPLRQVMRGPGDLSSQNLQLLAAAGELQKEAEKEPSAENLHAWGVALLLLGRAEEGVRALEPLAGTSPGSPVLTDLAAGYLARYRQFERAEDLPRALEAADRATALNPQNLEGLFNRALILDQLLLRSRAEAAWQEYVEHDPSSPWSRFAQERLKALQAVPMPGRSDSQSPRPGVVPSSQQPEAYRDWLQGRVLADWANATIDGRAGDAATALGQLVDGGAVLAERGDKFANALADCAARSAGIEARSLLALTKGAQLLAVLKVAAARAELAVAKSNSCAGVELAVGYFEALSAYHSGAPDLAKHRLAGAVVELQQAGYLNLVGRSWSLLGIIHGAQGEYSRALSAYWNAQAVFTQIGEADNAANMSQLMGDTEVTLGAFESAWRHFGEATAALSMASSPRRAYTTFVTQGVAARQMGLLAAATDFQQETLGILDAWHQPAGEHRVHLELARLAWMRGDEGGGRRHLAQAADALDRVDDPDIVAILEGQRLRVDLEFPPPDEATIRASLRHAETLYGKRRARLQWLEVQLKAVKAFHRLGMDAAAWPLIESALDLVELDRSAVNDAGLQMTYLQVAWDVFEEAVGNRFRFGDGAGALVLAERGRGRVVLPLESAQIRGLSVDDVQARLEDGDALIYTAELSGKWVAWVLTTTSIDTTEGDVSELRLGSTLGSAWSDADIKSASRAFLWPILAKLENAKRVFYCPDGVFSTIPLAALFLPDGTRLIQKAEIVWVPAARAIGRRIRRSAPTTAAVVAPDVATLPALPGARREAELIAREYAIEPVTGADAVPEALVKALTTARIVHFAGHAVANSSPAIGGYLALSGSRHGEVGTLTASELGLSGPLPGPVVVLAACRSALGPAIRGEGALSLARPLVAAGAAAVIGTLWDWPDGDWHIFVDVHRALRGGATAAQALRSAQLKALSQGLPSATWGGLISVGG